MGRLAVWLKYRVLASLSSCRLSMVAMISPRHCSSCHAQAGSCDTLLSIPWMQLTLFHVDSSRSSRCTVSWPKLMSNGKYPVLSLTVVLSAQSTTGRWSTDISFGSSEQPMRYNSASAIGLFPCSITPVVATWYGFMVIF